MKKKLKTSEAKLLTALEHKTPSSELPSLAAGLVHEVKNPLAAIHMHLQLLENYLGDVEDESLQNKLKDKVSLIQNEIVKLNQTLHGFFTILHPRSTNDNQDYNLDLLVEEVIRLLNPQALRENVRILFQKGMRQNRQKGDSSFLRQIILNLILNAIQALKNSQPESKERYIHISTSQKDGLISIRVKDNGPGIPEDVQKKMFEAFYTTNSDKKGHGLGLTLVQRMVASLGGHLEVESQADEGSCFTVILKQSQTSPKLLE